MSAIKEHKTLKPKHQDTGISNADSKVDGVFKSEHSMLQTQFGLTEQSTREGSSATSPRRKSIDMNGEALDRQKFDVAVTGLDVDHQIVVTSPSTARQDLVSEIHQANPGVSGNSLQAGVSLDGASHVAQGLYVSDGDTDVDDDDVESNNARFVVDIQARQNNSDLSLRSYTSFINHPDMLASYTPSLHASPLRDSMTARIFCHFINVTGPSLSLFERYPANPSLMFQGRPVPKSQQHIWTCE